MNNEVRENRKISLYYYIDRELSAKEKERLCLLEKEAGIRAIKTALSFWESEVRAHCGNKGKEDMNDKGDPEKHICISDNCRVLRYARDAGWAVIACRDFVLEEQERRGEDTYFISYAVEDLSVLDREYLETVYCRCHQLPRRIADTERLFIREIALSDLEDLMEVFDSNDKTDFFEAFYDCREDAEAFLDAYIRDVYRFYEYGIWGIYLKASEKMIGIAGFTPREGDGEKTVLELGYAVSKKYQNRGYAKEACRAVVTYAEENLVFDKMITVTKDGVKPGNDIADAGRTVIK